jgi:hypothetical protein
VWTEPLEFDIVEFDYSLWNEDEFSLRKSFFVGPFDSIKDSFTSFLFVFFIF